MNTNPDLEMINKLYLELSQFATAKTAKEIALEDKLELCRVFLAECKGDTDDRISPALKRASAKLFAHLFETPQAHVQYGRDPYEA